MTKPELTPCPRPDCTADVRHWHAIISGSAWPCGRPDSCIDERCVEPRASSPVKTADNPSPIPSDLEAAHNGNHAVLDMVNHPPHYGNHPSGVECITITEHMGFCVGNAIKYLWRADEKGNSLEDLKKARWYVDREIARREALT